MSVNRRHISRRDVIIGAALACLAASPAHAAETLNFDQLYKTFGVRGLEYSDRLLALRGSPVSMEGYMAPPLKAESHFFVLTRKPVSLCPFCESDADWPADIVVVYLDGAAPLIGQGEKVLVNGRLDVGPWTDPQTGFVSQIRITDAAYRRA
jgi:hypothetical protein